jgi:2-dehydropantoate 2-reductase
MKICIIGAGAMGGLYGARLIRAGQDVSFVDNRQDVVDNINRDGLHLTGVDGEHWIAGPASINPADFAPADIAFIHTDTNNTGNAALHAQKVLSADGAWAITFQNGIGNVETLQDVLGPARVAGGISYHSAASPAPGRSDHTNAGRTFIGELNGAASGRIRQLDDLLTGAGFDVSIAEDIESVIWSKFVLNCAVNPVSAITGLRTGEIGASEPARDFQQVILEEVLEVVQARGISLGDTDPRAAVEGFTGRLFNRPSMLQHMDAGLATEIDSLNGAVVREGQRLGVDTPFNQALTLLVKARNAQLIQALHGPPIDYQALEASGQADT